MNADDEKKLRDMCSTDIVPFSDYAYAYALGRRAGMTEAAGICKRNSEEYRDVGYKVIADSIGYEIEKARDA